MTSYVFKTRWRNEADSWSSAGPAITEAATLEAIRTELERGPVIVEHWHYRGGGSPSRYVFEDWEAFEAFLSSAPFAGDILDVWSFTDLCTSAGRIASGKCPADDGTVPAGGSY